VSDTLPIVDILRSPIVIGDMIFTTISGIDNGKPVPCKVVAFNIIMHSYTQHAMGTRSTSKSWLPRDVHLTVEYAPRGRVAQRYHVPAGNTLTVSGFIVKQYSPDMVFVYKDEIDRMDSGDVIFLTHNRTEHRKEHLRGIGEKIIRRATVASLINNEKNHAMHTLLHTVDERGFKVTIMYGDANYICKIPDQTVVQLKLEGLL
jgi:hypothetical protein